MRARTAPATRNDAYRVAVRAKMSSPTRASGRMRAARGLAGERDERAGQPERADAQVARGRRDRGMRATAEQVDDRAGERLDEDEQPDADAGRQPQALRGERAGVRRAARSVQAGDLSGRC